jgi:hypothetical protein
MRLMRLEELSTAAAASFHASEIFRHKESLQLYTTNPVSTPFCSLSSPFNNLTNPHV